VDEWQPPEQIGGGQDQSILGYVDVVFVADDVERHRHPASCHLSFHAEATAEHG